MQTAQFVVFVRMAFQDFTTKEGSLTLLHLKDRMRGALVNGLVNINISTIEKRYSLTSFHTGLISTGYDISFCALALFISYYGQKGHKPRWLAFAAFMLGLGSLVYSLPHFISGLYHYGSKITDTCVPSNGNSTTQGCTPSVAYKDSNFLYLFFLGQLLHGVGGTPLYTLGTAYLDDSVPNDKTSLYIGIGNSMSTLGPAIGFVLGGQMLDIYIDVNRVSNIDLTSDDPRRLGAWWIGFLLCWILSWSLIIPLSCFPKHLPGTEKIQHDKISQAHIYKGASIFAQGQFGENLKDLFKVLKGMLKNPVFLCLTAASCSEALVITGFVTFLPKFIENQFSQTASLAAILGGAALIPGAVIGQLASGIIMSKLKLLCRSMIKMAVATTVLSVLFSTVFTFGYCLNTPFAGVNQNYHYNNTKKFQLEALCNADCQCSHSSFNPVCDTKNVQYFSACYAGCINATRKGDLHVYEGCSCIPDDNPELSALKGKCGSTCSRMPLFLGVFLFCVIFTFMTSTSITTAVLRCVPDTQRSFSLGINWTFVRLLGGIPGPIFFGLVIDYSCILWNRDECNNQGACWIYDNPKMSYLMLAIGAPCKLFSVIAITAAYFLYKPPRAAETLSNGSNTERSTEDKDQNITVFNE
ncbi:solute carrier organic anion transporter family member 4C1-like [Hypanus sabinus]|uniref:solute carrier organic anion transporter family member 4C1-like n=1 Tax=Hypanus sabinus TaxID=79690 RepID=UPI0028C446F7|nr:solute carrier organic anion transporter family member 4C1-like [Hypanus sabinus]